MGLIDKALSVVGLQRKAESIETFKWTDERGYGTATTDAGEAVTPRSAMALSAVWGCANLVSGTISSLPFEARRSGKDGFSEIATDHPLHRVIYDSPNYDQTPLDFWDYLSLSIELWGNGYARKEMSGSRVIALIPIQPDTMSVRRSGSGALVYRWSENGQQFEGSDADVLHVRGPGGGALGGMSTLQFGREVFGTAQAADRAAASTFRNGMRPSGVLSFKEFLTPENRALTETKLTEKFLGAVNSGRPFIAEGGSTYSPLSISPKDAMMLETRLFSVEEICRFFQVPPVLIGHAGKTTAWPTSVEQQIILFQTFYLRKRLKRIEQAVNKQLLSAEDRARGISARFNMEGLLRGDSAARAAYYQTMTGIGVMTINEVCDIEGLRRKPGGDVPRMQMQNIPITETGAVE